MSEEAIRVGVIGAGENTTWRHIPGLQAIDGVEIVGVCNRSRESSERVANDFNISKTYDGWQDAIDDSDTNAIVIGTWPYMHCRTTIAALNADKHVMCEARMAMNAQEAHAMRDASREKPHLVAQIVPSPMTLGQDKGIKRLIAEGFLGDILVIEIRSGGSFLDPDAPLHWRENFDLSGLNIMSMGIWYEAVMRWVGEATRVMAMGKTFVRMRVDGEGIMHATRIPNHIDVTADMECGAQLHVQVSNVAGLAGTDEVFLFGSEGTLRIADDTLYGGQKDDSELSEIALSPDEIGAWRVEEEFVSAIRGQEAITHTNFEDGVKYMEFTEAVNISMETGTAVGLPL